MTTQPQPQPPLQTLPPLPPLTSDPIYQSILKQYSSPESISQLFKDDPERFKKFSLTLTPPNSNPLLLDYSKTHLTPPLLSTLLSLANSRHLPLYRSALLTGTPKINTTESRSVLHTALRRHPSDGPIILNGRNIMDDIFRVLADMEDFTGKVISGEWRGFGGDKLTDVVNIGIGGSDLGPCMVCEALTPYKTGLRTHFVSNVDESHLAEVLSKIDRKTTLFVIASKTFTTQETILNAESAKEWFLRGAPPSAIPLHFIALSTNLPKTTEFGIQKTFEFWDFVGGRYSLWSAIGLSIALQVGWGNFRELLDGARWMDRHFEEAPAEKNAPILLAMIGIYYNTILNYDSHAILPYDQYLAKLPAYLQQADMESNGKSTTINGERITDYNTGPIIWGQAGTNGQHAFYQLLHQGTRGVVCDFISFVEKNSPLGFSHHNTLLANFIAQPEALMVGRVDPKVEDPALKQHKYFPGNRPSNVILGGKLTPFMLGMLVALYEHKIFVQGVVWGVQSFDQWGVELGKELAKVIEPELEEGKGEREGKGEGEGVEHDSSTRGIIEFIRGVRGRGGV